MNEKQKKIEKWNYEMFVSHVGVEDLLSNLQSEFTM